MGTNKIATVLVFILFVMTGCVSSSYINKTCPGGFVKVVIKKSKSSNIYLAKSSEDARVIAKCFAIMYHGSDNE